MIRRWRSERGAGSIVVVAIMGAMVATTAGLLGLAGAHSAKVSLSAAADLSALAAADAITGAVSGIPCAAAGATAEINGVALDSCEVDGLEAIVSVRREFLGIRIVSRARAGPRAGSPPEIQPRAQSLRSLTD